MFSKKNLPKGFYVYEYLNEDGTPYYIGRGQKSRAWDKHKTVKVPDDIKYIHIIKDSLTDEESCFVEIGLIAHWGRKDILTGILENQTDGSETLRLLRTRKKRKELGNDWQNGRKFLYETQPEATALARKLASVRKRKPSLRKIAIALQQEGFVNAKGKCYDATSIQAMLKSKTKIKNTP